MTTNNFKHFIINPKNAEEAEELFRNNKIYGIEVVGKYATLCGFNLDPQHTDKLVLAAARAAVSAPLPDSDTIIVFSRLDPDAAAAAVILEDRVNGLLGKNGGSYPEDLAMRVDLISIIDEFSRGEWKPQQLPTRENRWPNSIELKYSAIASNMFDFKVTVDSRIEAMRKYLYTGEVDGIYIQKVEEERDSFIKELEDGKIQFRKEFDGDVCVVTSTSRNATTVAYANSPVGICINPEFRFNGNVPIRKWTICAYNNKYLDIKGLTEELNSIERGCGGNTTLVASPMGISSNIPEEKLLELVGKYLY